MAARRADEVDEALDYARQFGDADLWAEALLGQLHAKWGPDHLVERPAVLAELEPLHDDVRDEELRYLIRSWSVQSALDLGDLSRAEAEIDRFEAECEGTDLPLFPRRVRLWRANLSMLRGDIDEAVAVNQSVLADTAAVAGSPFSFQNAMVTFAIERYFRRGLADVIDPVRSVRASSPRVGANWDVALAFSLAECGREEEASAIFDGVVADGFAAVTRDLNWLPVMLLVALTAIDLEDRARTSELLETLAPFASLDATHGSGYASYGPVARVVGMLAARCGRTSEAVGHLATVLVERGSGPWTSLTRLELARLGVAVDELDPIPGPTVPRRSRSSVAEEQAEQAAAELQTMGLDLWAAEARQVQRLLRSARERREDVPTARRSAGSWSLWHPSGVATVDGSRGMDILVRMLAHPGEAFDVIDLDGVDSGLPRTSATEPNMDAAAMQQVRARIERIEGRPRPSSAEQAELTALRAAIAGGSYAPNVSAEVEKARVRVTKAVRRALAAISEVSPGLGVHLSSTVSTGRRCSYSPADGRSWQVEDGTDS
ncbi:MAG: hypothetical protein KDB02_12495 [Acidimicrobiales bacterium]|nr:hypothetical protein [Acidimicrobiales bacterium]